MTHLRTALSRAGLAGLLALASTLPLAGVTQARAAEPAATTQPRAGAEPARVDVAQYRVIQSRPDRLIATLPNGLVIIAQELRTAPVVSCQVWVKTGSIFEQEHVGAGLSHFLEHLLSAGSTSTRTEEQSNAILGQIGANVNAATSLDNVHYYINVTKAHTSTAIDLLSDWMLNATITEAEYERERDVIQREFDMGAGEPGRIFWKLTQMNRYKDHPARHPTIGYLDEFLKISLPEIRTFYKRMYVPNNMVFVVVGDINKLKVVQEIAERWQNARPGALPQIQLPVDDRAGGPLTASTTADIDRPRLRLAWPGTRLGAPNDYALDLLATVLGQGESSRLVKTVRDEQKLVTSVNAYNLSFNWGEGYFGVDAALAPKPGQPIQAALEAARAAILAQVGLIAEKGVTDTELDRAKRQVIAMAAYEGQSVESVASRLASDMIGTGNPDYLQDYARLVQSLTAADLQQAARQFLTEQRMLTLSLLPAPKGSTPADTSRPKEDPPAKPAPTQPVDLDNSQIVARFEQENAKRTTSARATEVDMPGIYTLSNGLRLIVQRSTLVPAVSIQYYSLGGLLADTQGREGVTSAAMSLLTRGTTTRTATQINSLLESLGASIDAQAGVNTAFVRATCLSSDLTTVAPLMADIILNPSFPADQWALLKPRLLAAIRSQNDAWNGELRSRFRDMYYADFNLSQSPLGRADVVESLTADDLRAFYQSRLGASESVLVVVGDVQPGQIVQDFEKLFGKLPAKAARPFVIPKPAGPVSRVEQFPTAKPLAAVQVGFGPAVERNDPDFAPLQVMSRVLSSFPTGWLDQELRGSGPGLVYAVGAGVNSGLLPGYFALLFNTRADSVPEALARAMRTVDRARNQLITPEELNRARASVLVDEFFAKQTNDSRAMDFGLAVLYGQGLDEQERYLEQIQKVTADDVRRVARKYLINPVGAVITNHAIPAEKLQQAFEGKSPPAQAPTPTTAPAPAPATTQPAGK